MSLRIAAVLMLSWIAAPCLAQEPALPPFACADYAVDITIDKDPPLRFVALDRRPALVYSAHQFEFTKAAFGLVSVHTLATVPEEFGGNGSDARLVIYVETAASMADLQNRRSQWWELVPVARPGTSSYDQASGQLLFDANTISACVTRTSGDCHYADVSPVSTDRAVPLVVVGFTRNLGGANARNWTHARLVLDFSVSPPRVVVGADCDYNEGGGACTAIDSGMMSRSTIACPWAADASDFLCTESGDEGHRDFYLFSGRAAPRRPSELASLEEAAKVLAGKAIGETVTVYRLGPVSLIDDVKLPGQRSAMLLATSRSFFLVSRSNNKVIGPIQVVRARGVLDPAVGGQPTGALEAEWTGESVPSFRSRSIFRAPDLTVLQVVETGETMTGEGAVASYWVGIGAGATGFAFDALRLTGRSDYGNCGMYNVGASAVLVGPIARPFRSSLRVQPPTVDRQAFSDDEELSWARPDGADAAEVECLRNGNLRWKGGRFEIDIERGRCAAAEKPQRITIAPDGSVRFEKPGERKR